MDKIFTLLFFFCIGIMPGMADDGGKQATGRDVQAKLNVEAALNKHMKPSGLRVGCPVFIRIIKEDRMLELWGSRDNKPPFSLIKKYPVAGMSGELGPKQREGDMQAPEGFYSVVKSGLNPKSNYHLSFNIGYPNEYDLSLGRTGSLIMVHGSHVSIGCFAITDQGIEEVYTMVAEALKSGQDKVPVHIYPFIPTPERMAKEKQSEFYEFWKKMQKAWNETERKKAPVRVSLADR